MLPPVKRAAISSAGGADTSRKMVASLDRLGRVSKFNLNCVLSPSRRGVMRDFSSRGERGGTVPGSPCHP